MTGPLQIKTDPSHRELVVFGVLWLGFFAALGVIAWWKPGGLLGAAVVLGAAWLGSLILNPVPRRHQLVGVALPALFAAAGGIAVAGGPAGLGLAGLGLAGAVVIWAAPGWGRRLYVTWMQAAAPIGWTISHLALALVYYLVLTPIGLIMRLAGRDPLPRRFDRAAASYWIPRSGPEDPARSFRQF